jgi:hypothetical protein
MDENMGEQTATGALTWEKVAASAIKQAARHERALEACLAELGGTDLPTSDLAESTRRRALRHAERAIGLAKTAVRVNRDPLAEMFFAALLERHERNALLVAEMAHASEAAALPVAG